MQSDSQKNSDIDKVPLPRLQRLTETYLPTATEHQQDRDSGMVGKTVICTTVQLTLRGIDLTGVVSRSLCKGRIYVRAVPTRCFRMDGEDIANPERGSRVLEFGMHRKNWYPPPSISWGKVWNSTS